MNGEQYCQWCERETARRNVSWFGRYVDIGAERIHYVDHGSGEPVVLIHGLLAWSYSWRHNVASLAEHHRVLALDLRGFGLSERNSTRGHSLNDQVEVVRAFMDAMGVERAVLCGHSMGGEIAMRFALKYPDRVRALVLVSSSGYVYREKPLLERAVLRLPGVSSLFVRAAVMNRKFAARSLGEAYRRPGRFTEADVDAYLLPAGAPGTPQSFVRVLQDIDFGATAAELKQVAHKALIIWGADDPWVSLRFGERLASELPNAELLVIEHCGHSPQEEYPEEFDAAVLAFLSQLAP